MRYVIEVNSRTEYEVELTETDRGSWTADVSGERDVDLDLLGRDEDGAYVVRIDGEEHRFHVDRDSTSVYLTDDRDMVNVNVDRAADVVLDQAETERRGELDLGTLESPMTGVVLDVLVDEGEDVRQGEPALVLEAMKMENTVSVPADGTVENVAVEEDERVFNNDLLLEIDRQNEA